MQILHSSSSVTWLEPADNVCAVVILKYNVFLFVLLLMCDLKQQITLSCNYSNYKEHDRRLHNNQELLQLRSKNCMGLVLSMHI